MIDVHADPHLSQTCNVDIEKYCDHTLTKEGKGMYSVHYAVRGWRIWTVFVELKRLGHVMLTNFFRNDSFAVFWIGHITVISHYYSQNESVISQMDSRTS